MMTFYGTYRTRKFTEIFETPEEFLTEYKSSALYTEGQKISDAKAKELCALLYARHGNDPIASTSEDRFKYALWATIYQYGPSWETKLSIQSQMRALTLDDITSGNYTINNSALHPQEAPEEQSEILSYINEQNVSKDKKSKLNALRQWQDFISSDVTSSFLQRFDKLFRKIVTPSEDLYYTTETEN